jgi:hypothetical protein
MCLSHVFSILKKIGPKTCGPHCVYECTCRCLLRMVITVHGQEQDKFYYIKLYFMYR